MIIKINWLNFDAGCWRIALRLELIAQSNKMYRLNCEVVLLFVFVVIICNSNAGKKMIKLLIITFNYFYRL